MKRIIWFILSSFLIVSCGGFSRSIYTDHNNKLEASTAKDYIKNGGVVVILKAQKNKLDLFQKFINSPTISEGIKEDYKNRIVKVKEENIKYATEVMREFENYKVGPVFFIPDSLYKGLLNDGEKTNIFVGQNNKIDSTISVPSNYLVMIDKDKYDFELLGPNHEFLKDPFPYKYSPRILYLLGMTWVLEPRIKRLTRFINVLNKKLS